MTLGKPHMAALLLKHRGFTASITGGQGFVPAWSSTHLGLPKRAAGVTMHGR